MGFNSAFKGLMLDEILVCCPLMMLSTLLSDIQE
jgi:hypothetical protein